MIFKRSNRVKVLTIAIIIYMLAALSWWSVLLLRMNEQIHSFNATNSNPGDQAALLETYERQKNMILGEGFVFAMALVIGIYLLYRSYQKEVTFTTRQNNFLLSVTHEFKTPLSVMKLINQTLRNRKLEPVKQEELFLTNETEISRLENLVNNLLASTQIDHAYKPNFETIDLTKFLREKTESNLNRWPQTIHFESTTNASVQIDQELFALAIQNILDNASKYSPDDSEIRVSISHKNKQVSIGFVDNGIGISAKDQKHIFDKFYRSENEDTRNSKGTGLGLYLAKEIIQLHHGSIDVRSKIGNGSSFIINLPALS